MYYIRILFTAFVAVFVGACALKPIPYDRSSAGEIKTIGVITPAMPNHPAVVLASSVGQSFGLIGGLVDAAMQQSREDTFKTAIATKNFSAADICWQTLSTELTAQGYTPVAITVERSQHDFLEKYPADSPPKVDAYLDTVVSYGYIAAGIGSTPYRPIVYITARLVRATDSTVLMQDAISYNPVGPYAHNSQSVTIPPDPNYQFSNFDVLAADPDKAVQGMQTALTQSAKTFGELLK